MKLSLKTDDSTTTPLPALTTILALSTSLATLVNINSFSPLFNQSLVVDSSSAPFKNTVTLDISSLCFDWDYAVPGSNIIAGRMAFKQELNMVAGFVVEIYSKIILKCKEWQFNKYIL
jgi:hypothetical protein